MCVNEELQYPDCDEKIKATQTEESLKMYDAKR